MCENCGCGRVESFKIIPHEDQPGTYLAKPGGGQEPADRLGRLYAHSLPHLRDDSALQAQEPSLAQALSTPGATHPLPVHLPILAKNDLQAQANREFFAARGMLAINFVSSPGSGKTTFLAKSLEMLGRELPAAVIVGDLETANDAARLRGRGAPVVQVTTGTVCHLDAEMVGRGLASLDLSQRRLLLIENVGNLVCPASFDLGEAFRVVLLSVTEGEDKPLKYPPIFRGAKAVVLSKMDLLAATGFDLALARRNIQAVAPEARIVEVSARTGEGIGVWREVLRAWAGDQQIRGNCSPVI